MPNPTMQVFDKNFKRTGTLIDAYDIERKRRINSDYEITFMVPMTSDDYLEKIQLKGHVRDERGQFYVIQSRSRSREGRKLTANIYCNHVMFKLVDFKFPYASYVDEAYGVHISTLTNAISAATGGRFTFQIHDTFALHDVKDWGRGDCLQALNDVIKIYECEVEPDNFVIHLKKKIGSDSGLQYRLKKNIVSSSFKDIGEKLVTRLYGQMKDGRTFIGMDASKLTEEERTLLSQVPGAIVNGKLAVNYLISPYASYWSSDSVPFYDGELINQDIEEPEDLLEAMRNKLREQEQPELEATISTADLFKIDNTEPKPGLGDVVTCIDPKMGMNKLKARITELIEYPYSRSEHSQPTISNVKPRDYEDIIADLQKSKDLVDNMFSNGKIRTEVFEAAAKQVIIDINNSKTELVYPPDGGILAREKDNPLRQVRLTAAGLGVSTDGWKTIRAAVTADGIIGERIIGQIGNFESLSIGSGNDIILLNHVGLSAGNANFNDAPFRVDMKGNLVANKLTANSAQINSSNFNSGSIVGSSINIGNGKFTVSRSGSVYAEGGIFSGGTITGALFRTAATGRRIEINSGGVIGYNSSGEEVVSLGQTHGGGGLVFSDNGSPRGDIYGDSNGLRIGNMGGIYIESRDDLTYFRGEVDFSRATVNGLDISQIDQLQEALDRVERKIDALRGDFYQDAVINAAFDSGTRNLKLYSRHQTVATVTIPK
ncbi:phage tail protein [Paenibacillus macerans]|uniref:phage tail protein n=1 Tax=Paenibacillus macerans TaxID=44252 RepID=UPI002DBF4694|nr:phage tail protein [Paenibacillus macerans]MEC0136115.1 phage tail protein [Paenibacillus macerans]